MRRTPPAGPPPAPADAKVNWVSEHSDVLNVLLNGAMLLVWTAYANLFFLMWRRGRLPALLVTLTTTLEDEAEFVLCNMAEETCFLESIALCLKTRDGEGTLVFLNDLPDRSGKRRDTPEHSSPALAQQPLKNGERRSCGASRELLRKAAESCSLELENVRDVEIRAIAYYGVRRRAFGAIREFRLIADGQNPRLQPKSHFTRHLTSRREREEVDRWLGQFYRES